MNDDLHNAYRPQDFSEMYGQDAIVKSLSALEEDVKKGKKKWPHSYLLVGNAGSGKTTTARILAQKFGCSKQNIIEVDGATCTGIDNIRQLTSGLQYRALGKQANKVYIIDECHRISRQAFDALLKSLEEPPEHAYFILCTTEKDKVPKTIVSRCIEFVFKPIRPAELEALIDDVCASEKITLPDGIAAAISRKADGSPRMALTILAKVATADNKKEALELMENMPDEGGVIELCRMMVSGKGFTWQNAVPILRNLQDENPESVRMVVINYVGKALLSAESDRAATPLLAILEKFRSPFNQSEKMVPVMLAVGELLFEE